MKIVITHTDFRLYWPSRLAALSRLIREKGHSLQVIEIAGKGSPYAFSGSSAVPTDLDWICLFPDRAMETLSIQEASAALFDKLEELQPAVVLAGSIAFSSGATAVRWCKIRGKPVVIFDNSRLKDVPRSWFVNFIKKCIYNNVDAVISPAPSQANAFEYWGVDSERIFFGLNVVDNSWFATRVEHLSQDPNRFREEMKMPRQFILGIGRLVEKKNWIKLVEAFNVARLTKPNNDWYLVLVGDGPMKVDLEKLCKSPGYSNVILRPFVSQEDLCKYYALTSALILPSHYGETWGLVVNEAMACGLPVLVSNQCGCAETLVEPGKNGYLFSPDDKSELVEVLEHFFGYDFQLRLAMGERSKEIISKWSLDRFSQGAWQAIQYSLQCQLGAPSFFDALIINYWKGRYRPV